MQQTHPRKDAGTRTGRAPRRGVRREQRPRWVSPLRRMNRAIASSLRMAESTRSAVDAAWDHASSSPIRTTRDLHRLSGRLLGAAIRLQRAARSLRETCVAMLVEPERAGEVPPLLNEATERLLLTGKFVDHTFVQLATLQDAILDDLEAGLLPPEAEQPKRRPIISITPRIITARDFLLCRRMSAHDRIASIPVRRRPTVCRATTDAPRRICRGRAPPLFSTCLL